MTNDINMQHMTMREYVAVAMLSELATKDAVLKMIGDGETTASKVVESCFNWADIFMHVRAERNAKTKET
jgi:hypothetical protein